MYKCYINGTRPLFSTNYSALRSNVYCTPKTEEILNLTVCVRFRFLHLRNIRGRFFRHSQKSTSETDTSSASQLSTR